MPALIPSVYEVGRSLGIETNIDLKNAFRYILWIEMILKEKNLAEVISVK